MARKRNDLGERHRKILEFLTTFQEENGYPPTIREIGYEIGVKSTSLIDYYLNQLKEWNYIDRDDRISRSIRVIKPAPQQTVTFASTVGNAINAKVSRVVDTINDLLSIPVIAEIKAGTPLVVGDEFDSDYTVEIARSMLPPREKVSELYALRVSGDSMIDAMVNDGDIVIMKKAQEARNGEMVAVLLNDKKETTLKYFYKEHGQIRLQPANPTMEPIIVQNPAELMIQGKVVMVVRQVWHA
ncbi:MAG TPA: transcriptional repressor LexA [Anaerolineaceae bacterium]